MNPLVHPLVLSWLSLAAQSSYHPYTSSLEPSEHSIICIDKDLPRTIFFNGQQLSSPQKQALRNCLIRSSQEFSQLGYRSGFNFIVAFINKLTNNNVEYTFTIFKYILFSQNIGFGKLLLDQQTSKIVSLFDALLYQQIPSLQNPENRVLNGYSMLTSFLTLFLHNGEWENVDQVARLWDRVFRGNIFMVVQMIVEYVKIKGKDNVGIGGGNVGGFKMNIDEEVVEELIKLKARDMGQYWIEKQNDS